MLQLYDLAGIYFRAFYAVPSSMTGPHGEPINAIRGSLDILARVIADAEPTRGVACLDVDWRPAWRVELVPSYKAHRVAVTEPVVDAAASELRPVDERAAIGQSASGAVADVPAGTSSWTTGTQPDAPTHRSRPAREPASPPKTPAGVPAGTSSRTTGTQSDSSAGDPLGALLGSAVDATPGALAESVPDELSPQVPILLDVLRAIGIPLAGAHGCEADDVIGTLAAREVRDPVEVVSGDRDLFQVVRTTPTPVTVRYIGAGMSKARVYDEAALRDHYGVDGAGYAAMATLRGDPSDGLPGVAGIGEKTATGLITRFGSLDALLAAALAEDASLSPGVRRKLAAAADYLPAAALVVAVRIDADVHTHPGRDELPREPVDPETLAHLAAEHGLGGSIDRLLDALARH